MTSTEIEIAIANKWGVRQSIIVPNISWGFDIHECDLLIVSNRGYLTEIEIKISKSDLKKDLEKRHKHESQKIKYLFFAVPKKLESCIDLIPERAGIIICEKNQYNNIKVVILRKPIRNIYAKPISDQEKYLIARLGTMRIFRLKKTIVDLRKKVISLKS